MRIETAATELETLTPALFARFAEIAYESAGIKLKPGKESLVLARVNRRVRALGLKTVQEYADYLQNDKTENELVHFLDVISTNVTSFFREKEHFDFLRVLVDEAARSGKRRLRFWSAACSSGEEPYTLAMVLDDMLGSSVDWRILATDVSTQVLGRAAKAVYGERTVEPVPAAFRQKYLRKEGVAKTGEEALWAVVPPLRDRVMFRRLNLAQPPFPMRGPMDVIMCRNVMIYFDDVVRLGIVREAERLLVDGGVFITSHTETLTGLKMGLRAQSPSIYVKGR